MVWFIVILVLLVAWGLRIVPKGKQWLPIFLGKRLDKRYPEGLVWLPRWIFTYEEYDIREQEFYALDDSLKGRQQETIMTTNGVEVIVRKVIVYYSISRQDGTEFTGWRKILRFFGCKPGMLLFKFSQVGGQDALNRLPQIVLQGLRTLIPPFRFQDLLGLSIEGLDAPVQNLDSIINSRTELQDRLTKLCAGQAESWGLEIHRVVVDDIDPNDDMKAALQAKARALAEKQAALVHVSAFVEQSLAILIAAGVDKPGPTELLDVYTRIRSLDNAQLAAIKTGDLGMIFQNVVQKTAAAILPTPPEPVTPVAPVAA